MLSLSKMFGYVDKPQIELQRISGEGGIRPRRHEGLAAVLVLALVVQVFAGFALRGLYADGAYFVTQIISHQSFMHVAPCLSPEHVSACGCRVCAGGRCARPSPESSTLQSFDKLDKPKTALLWHSTSAGSRRQRIAVGGMRRRFGECWRGSPVDAVTRRERAGAVRVFELPCC